jgi:hypothetical protein
MNDIERARLENKLEMQRKGLHKIIDGVFDGLRAELCPDGPRTALELRLAMLENEIAHIRRQIKDC